MDGARRAVVEPLVALASSPGYLDRADAGRGLAVFADVPQARDTLVDLVLDSRDTFVTRATAEALLRREDRTGYTIVSRALAVADDNHADWIHTAIDDVFVAYAHERDAAVRECETLLDDTDEHVRIGAHLLMTALRDLEPVLVPREPEGTERAGLHDSSSRSGSRARGLGKVRWVAGRTFALLHRFRFQPVRGRRPSAPLPLNGDNGPERDRST